MRKPEKTSRWGLFGKVGKTVIAIEAGLFFTSFFVWKQLNESQDSRAFMYKQFPWLLESYYQFGEKIDQENIKIRNADYEKWRMQGIIRN